MSSVAPERVLGAEFRRLLLAEAAYVLRDGAVDELPAVEAVLGLDRLPVAAVAADPQRREFLVVVAPRVRPR